MDFVDLGIALLKDIFHQSLVSVLSLSVIDSEFYTNNCTCCFSTKHTLRSKSKDWLAWNKDNVANSNAIGYVTSYFIGQLHYRSE